MQINNFKSSKYRSILKDKYLVRPYLIKHSLLRVNYSFINILFENLKSKALANKVFLRLPREKVTRKNLSPVTKQFFQFKLMFKQSVSCQIKIKN